MEHKRDLSAAALHILAMALMLCDHLSKTLLPYQQWLGGVGRLAFPIFAFLLVEGYFHTRDLRRYMGRLLVLAVVTEIPFDLMSYGALFYPFHQNVIWCFLLALLLICLIERAKATGKRWLYVLAVFGAVLLGFVLGIVTMVDYNGPGVVMVLVFYLFRGTRWPQRLGQLVCLYYINFEVMGGLVYPVTLFGHYMEISHQGLAVLALLPLWLYQGRQGYHSKGFRWFCYGFYPAHMLVLYAWWKLTTPW